MATNFSTVSVDEMRIRRGHDMTWSCDIHAEPIKFRCKEHNITLCLPCAVKDHQKPCHLEDIEKVILDMEKQLEEKQKEIDDAKTALERDEAEIKSVETSMRTHLQTVNDEVNARYEKEIENLKEKEQKEIRRINEERDKKIKECRERIEQQRKDARNVQQKGISECKEIEKLVCKKIENLRNKNQHTIATVRNIDQKMKQMKQNDEQLVTGAPRTIASLDETLSTNNASAQKDCLRRLKRGVESVKLMKGGVYDKYFSRFRGDMVYWELFKEIQMPEIGHGYDMTGLISDNEICLYGFGFELCVMNVENERTDNVETLDFGITFRPTSCASAGGNLVVCGTRDYLPSSETDGLIILYSRQHGVWKVVRKISIPRNSDSENSCQITPLDGHHAIHFRPSVYVDVDMDGMILAGEEKRPDIFVINPADGKIVSTITIQGEKVGGRIRSLPSGNIWVKCREGAIIISRSGEIISRESSLEGYDYCGYITSSGYKIVQDSKQKILVLKSV